MVRQGEESKYHQIVVDKLRIKKARYNRVEFLIKIMKLQIMLMLIVLNGDQWTVMSLMIRLG